jgi:Heterokaryon incompatibility protein (HET)
MSSAYDDHHLPLDPESRWIRVFDLQPTLFGNQDEPIRGQLRVVCLDDSSSYVALSYAWGNSVASRQIACGANEGLSVTTNCYDALQQLRHSFRTRTLWVDSICVNQSNEEEKSHEVSLMQDIYDRAEKVYIWLGKGNHHSDYAMDWLANATLDLSLEFAVRVAPFPEFLRPRDLSRLLRMILEQARVGRSFIPYVLLPKS